MSVKGHSGRYRPGSIGCSCAGTLVESAAGAAGACDDTGWPPPVDTLMRSGRALAPQAAASIAASTPAAPRSRQSLSGRLVAGPRAVVPHGVVIGTFRP